MTAVTGRVNKGNLGRGQKMIVDVWMVSTELKDQTEKALKAKDYFARRHENKVVPLQRLILG